MSSFFLARHQLTSLGLVAFAALGLAACEDTGPGGAGMSGSARASHPLAPEIVALMERKGVSQSAPILIRTYKKEAEFEIWKMKADGRYSLLKTFPMCRWSGQLGPKMREGDRQVPEGFYRITPGQMNPTSQYYLSFNVGYPNAYDRSHGASGGSIFVHGACSSAGCFSMTDAQIDQIYAVAREAFAGGQGSIQMQSYPFHMTPENMAKYRDDPNIAFWKQLKEGADNFEVSKQDVNVGVCSKHYVFNTTTPAGRMDPSGPCPSLQHDGIEAQVAARRAEDDAAIAKLVAAGTPSVRTIYADGGQNSEFSGTHLADVSRPEALAAGPTEWLSEPAATAKKASSVVKFAGASKETSKGSKPNMLAKAKANPAALDLSDRTSSIKKPAAASNDKPAAPAKPQASL